MAIPPEMLRLPDGYGSTGDPVESNPFNASDPRHAVWNDATRAAEEQVSRLDAHLLQEVPTTIAELNQWRVELFVGRFDAWSKRSVHVVWSDAMVRHFDQWLVSYANASLGSLATSAIGSDLDRETAIVSIRTQLASRVKYWQAEARRYRADQESRVTSIKTEDEREGYHGGTQASVQFGSPVLPVDRNGHSEVTPAKFMSGAPCKTGPATVLPHDSAAFDIAAQDLSSSDGRRAAMSAFLASCNQTTQDHIEQHHIWKSMKHTTPRSFQYWLAMKPVAKQTKACDQNIRRILSMSAADFVGSLRDRRLI